MVTWFTGQAAAGLSTMTTARPACLTTSAITSRTNASVVGEYVSLNEGGKMHTYRVTSVSYL